MVEIELCTPLDSTQKSFPPYVLVIATANKISQCVADQDQSLRQRQICPVARWKQPCQSPLSVKQGGTLLSLDLTSYQQAY